MSRSPVLRPFFTYFGGKWRIAPRYPAPDHQTLVEPFAGSAGYALRYPHLDVRLVDANEAVAGTWEYIIRAPESEILALPTYDGTWETVDDLTYLPQEARWLIGWWLNKGTAAPAKRPSSWMRKNADNLGENHWGPGARARVARQQQYVRHWTMTHGDYKEIDNIKATWFIDPPYQVAGKYPTRDVDFSHLGEWSRSRQGQVLVCENVGADWLPFEEFVMAKGTHARYRSGKSAEALWTNVNLDEEVARAQL